MKDLVLVEWIDAFDMPDKWVHVSEIETDKAIILSVGWLIEPSPVEGYLTLGTSKYDEIYGGGIHIPTSCIISIKKVKVK